MLNKFLKKQKRKAARNTEEKILTIQELQSEEPVDIAKRYADDLCINFTDEMVQIFNEAIQLINEESSK